MLHFFNRYQCQDLRCPDTTQVQLSAMTEYCPESSKRYNCDVSPDAIKHQLKTFLNISRYHRFEWLEEVVCNLLQIEFGADEDIIEDDLEDKEQMMENDMMEVDDDVMIHQQRPGRKQQQKRHVVEDDDDEEVVEENWQEDEIEMASDTDDEEEERMFREKSRRRRRRGGDENLEIA